MDTPKESVVDISEIQCIDKWKPIGRVRGINLPKSLLSWKIIKNRCSGSGWSPSYRGNWIVSKKRKFILITQCFIESAKRLDVS